MEENLATVENFYSQIGLIKLTENFWEGRGGVGAPSGKVSAPEDLWIDKDKSRGRRGSVGDFPGRNDSEFV